MSYTNGPTCASFAMMAGQEKEVQSLIRVKHALSSTIATSAPKEAMHNDCDLHVCHCKYDRDAAEQVAILRTS